MKASKKRAARHKRAAFVAHTYEAITGRLIKAEGDNRLMATITLNKVARLTGNRIDFSRLVVKAK
jgi:hypothetical protein